MRRLPPIPWSAVTPGTVVMIDATPRTVITHDGTPTSRMVFLEGLAPIVVDPTTYAFPVELDTADAISALYTAGLSPTPIGD